jgi:hypothetical protein
VLELLPLLLRWRSRRSHPGRRVGEAAGATPLRPLQPTPASELAGGPGVLLVEVLRVELSRGLTGGPTMPYLVSIGLRRQFSGHCTKLTSLVF